MGDVEPHASLGGPPPFLDLRVGSQGHAVAGGQLHTVRVVASHEPFPEHVAQDPALTPSGLADQGAGRVLRLDDPGRVELDQLRVAQAGSGLHGQAEGVAHVLVAP